MEQTFHYTYYEDTIQEVTKKVQKQKKVLMGSNDFILCEPMNLP